MKSKIEYLLTILSVIIVGILFDMSLLNIRL